jgi:hypothetical protein
MVEKTFAELYGDERIAYGNRLIDRFSGKSDTFDSPYYKRWPAKPEYVQGWYCRMNYHYNWSSLMSVWEKILTLPGVNGEIRKTCTIVDLPSNGYVVTFLKNEGSFALTTWASCVCFIEWYNKNNNGKI